MAVSAGDDAVVVDIPPAVEYEITERRRLYRVPRHLREKKKHLYDPVVLSLGPYHHGQVEFPQIDELKKEAYSYMLESIGGDKVMDMFRRKIRDKIHDIRNFYIGVSEDKYNDEALTEMMVRDACFVLYSMEGAAGDWGKAYEFLHRLGPSGYTFMMHDFFLLDNQIPLCVIKFLISLKYADSEGEELFRKFLSYMKFRIFGDRTLEQLPWKDDQPQPLHLLEAVWAASLIKEKSDLIEGNIGRLRKWAVNSSDVTLFELKNCQFRSVMDLKAKGVKFQPSSYFLKDIRFDSHRTHGTLQLPKLFVTNNTTVLFSNMIGFEMSPESEVDSIALPYVNFMKSLIQKPEDVKELLEKRILFSSLGNDEEVVNIFKEIDTHGAEPTDFLKIKMRINEHCNSKAKTWMAELIHSKFRNPWTTTALFAAILLLCLTFLQTYYTIHQEKRN